MVVIVVVVVYSRSSRGHQGQPRGHDARSTPFRSPPIESVACKTAAQDSKLNWPYPLITRGSTIVKASPNTVYPCPVFAERDWSEPYLCSDESFFHLLFFFIEPVTVILSLSIIPERRTSNPYTCSCSLTSLTSQRRPRDLIIL